MSNCYSPNDYPMKSSLIFSILIPVLFFTQKSIGQKIAAFKPPIVTTNLGGKSNGDSVKPAEGTRLITSPLKVTDKAGIGYEVINYRFAYKKKGYREDPETGKITTVYTMSAARFDHSPLPKSWTDNIKLSLQKDEELSFFEILVKDKQGRIFYAPDVHLYIN